MNFKKPSSKALQDAATLVGGIAVGSAVSRGVYALIHKDETKATPEDQKKHDNMGLVKRAAITVLTAYVGAGISGNDTVSSLSRNALYGMSVMQLLELVKQLTAKSSAGQDLAASNQPAKQFLARTLGLGCACDTNQAQYELPVARLMGMRNPANVMANEEGSMFENALSTGQFQAVMAN
jgi:hypothetical protein